jgi:hypothetical protein
MTISQISRYPYVKQGAQSAKSVKPKFKGTNLVYKFTQVVITFL